jgi:hypothetical protein
LSLRLDFLVNCLYQVSPLIESRLQAGAVMTELVSHQYAVRHQNAIGHQYAVAKQDAVAEHNSVAKHDSVAKYIFASHCRLSFAFLVDVGICFLTASLRSYLEQRLCRSLNRLP